MAINSSNPLIEKLEELELKVSDIFDSKGIKYRRWWRDLLIPCPFHEDSHPSMTVREDGLAFHCFWCKVKGTIVKLLAKLEKKNYKQILKELGIEIEDNLIPSDEKIQELLEQLKKMDEIQEEDNTYEYLEETTLDSYKIYGYQDIPAYLLNRFKWNFKWIQNLIDKFWIGYDKVKKFITIPIRDENWLLMAVYARNANDNIKQQNPRYMMFEKIPWFSKNKYIFNIDKNQEREELIVFEWPLNAMLMNMYWLENAVSLYWTDISFERTQLLSKNRKRLFLWFDADKAGSSRLINIYNKLNWQVDLYFMQTEKDVFEYTKDEIASLMQQFKPLFVFNNTIYNI